VSFIDRQYPDIARDILTNLTQGVARELHTVEYDPQADPPELPEIVLRRRPVRRVSFVSGFIAAADPEQPPRPFTFTRNDYELIGGPEDPDNLHTIRFRPHGRKPAPSTTVTVNYYPRSADPSPITDLNVGGVARTVVEALSRELALVYAQLNLAYEAGFVETAPGRSLDRVVALLGYRRFRAGRPTGTVTFRRRPGSTGNITIPAGTPVTDAEDSVRYETSESRVMLAGESTAEVRVRGASQATAPVEAGVLSVIQRAIAGLDSVANEAPTSRASQDETDEELRTRARDALLAASKGTVEAIRFGLLQMPEVRDVEIAERPNGVPGEVRVSVSLAEGEAEQLPPSIRAKLDQLRPAGVRVLTESAASASLAAHVELVLAGAALPEVELTQIRKKIADTLAAEVSKSGVGARIRTGPLTAKLLADERIVDARLALSLEGEEPGALGEDFQAEKGAAVRLSAENVTFAAPSFAEEAGEEETIPVEVRANLGLTLESGVSLDAAKAALRAKLEAFFNGLQPGVTVDAASLLNALRDDSQYAIDPLRLTVTLTAEGQFVQIAQGGPAFTAQPSHRFTVAAVEVSP